MGAFFINSSEILTLAMLNNKAFYFNQKEMANAIGCRQPNISYVINNLIEKGIVENAQALCKGLMDRGVKIVSGGTDNHLMLVDLTNFDLTGKEVEKLLDMAHITANKNTIPNDPKSPFVTSGIRLGTPAVTSRGMNAEDMDKIAEAIALVIKGGEAAVPQAREIVQELTDKYPLV